MSFWDHVNRLRASRKIPRRWKRTHLRPYLEQPRGQYARSSIDTIPSNESISGDGVQRGDSVKRGREPKAWRLGYGEFELIADPCDDEITQDANKGMALKLAQNSRSEAPRFTTASGLSGLHVTTEHDADNERLLTCLKEVNPQLISSLTSIRERLYDYDNLQKSLFIVNTAVDPRFQRRFNAYYRVRQKNKQWYKTYYSILEREKYNRSIRFSCVLENLSKKVGTVELSFASKLVATINPETPVYDENVRKCLNLARHSAAKCMDERIRKAVEIYDNLTDRTRTLTESASFAGLRESFDHALPEFRHFTDIKKLDLFLWRLGA